MAPTGHPITPVGDNLGTTRGQFPPLGSDSLSTSHQVAGEGSTVCSRRQMYCWACAESEQVSSGIGIRKQTCITAKSSYSEFHTKTVQNSQLSKKVQTGNLMFNERGISSVILELQTKYLFYRVQWGNTHTLVEHPGTMVPVIWGYVPCEWSHTHTVDHPGTVFWGYVPCERSHTHIVEHPGTVAPMFWGTYPVVPVF